MKTLNRSHSNLLALLHLQADGRLHVLPEKLFSVIRRLTVFVAFWTVLNVRPCFGSEKPVAVFDATGETVAVLEQMGVKHKWFTPEAVMLGSTSFAPYSMLIIGKDSLAEAVRNFTQNIPFSHTVKEGFNVLVLSQKAEMIAGLATRRMKSVGVRQIVADFPDCKPLISSDILAFVKPQYGNFHCILENENDPELAPVIVSYEGKGKIIFSQLKLIENYDSNPAAALILRQMISECMNPAKPVMNRAGYLGGRDGRRVFDELKIACRPGTGFGNVALAWLPELDERGGAQLKSFVEGGGIVVTLIANAEDAAKLPVKFLGQGGEFESGSVPSGALFRGLSSDDLAMGESVEVVTITGVNGKTLENPVLGAVRSGKGWIIYIQLLPDMCATDSAKAKVRRIWSVVMTNLGVAATVAPDFLLSNTDMESEDIKYRMGGAEEED